MGKYNWSDRQDERRESRRPKPEKIAKVIKTFSKKAVTDNEHYRILRKTFLIQHLFCQCGRAGCTKLATEVHHKKGRGIWLLVVEFWLAVCNNCHRWIEEHPAEAKEKGYSVNRLE